MVMPLNDFADRLNTIIPVIMKEFAYRQKNELYKGKITLPQFIILGFLHQSGLANMTDLAKYMKVTTSAMTGIISRLVRAGYVQRKADSKDRRIIKVKLSSRGASLVLKVEEERRQMIIDVFGQISEHERQEYLNILGRIKNILTQPTQA